MTAINKMVEWYENPLRMRMPNEEDYGIYIAGLEEARRLAAEEAKDKPKAHASLVEKLGKLASRLYDVRVALYGPEVSSELMDIISRYRPASTADIVGELKEWEAEMFSLDRVTPSAHNRFNEIVRKWEEK